MISFGKELKEEFLIEQDSVCVNNCSYGYVPKKIAEQRFENSKQFLQNPDKYIRYYFPDIQKKIRKVAAEFLNANYELCFLTNNSAESFNSIIRNLGLTQDDIILYSNIAYPMIRNTIQFMNSHYKVKLCCIDLKIVEINKESILQIFEEQLSSQQIKVAVFDNITAQPSFKMPVKELIQLCKKYNTISIVDAAHGAGIRDLNIQELDPDFLFTNFNKWAFCPTGVNLLYMKQQYLNQIHNNTISVFYGTSITKEFEYYGTKDQSLCPSIIDGINFINKYGLQNIIKYCEDLAWDGANLVAKIWETQLMVNDKQMHSAMVNVQIPHDDEKFIRECQKQCVDQYNVFIVTFNFEGKNWARFSACVYNSIEDYEYAANSFLKILKQK